MQTVCFGLALKYDTGRQTGVAMHGDTVIEVHKSEKRDDLWYHVGKTAFDAVDWAAATSTTPALPRPWHLPEGGSWRYIGRRTGRASSTEPAS